MERGLLWLPLLVAFIWLAWLGWHEYQKIEAYRRWAEQFERAKYDIYAVLGQKGKQLSWGKPTRLGPVDLQTLSLDRVKEIRLLVGDRPIDLDSPPRKGSAALEFELGDGSNPVKIPFTEIPLAAQWGKVLLQNLEE